MPSVRVPRFALCLALLMVTVLASLGFSPTFAAGTKAPDFSKLEKQYGDLHIRGSYEEALAVAEQMVDHTFPRHVAACYNVAAMHCRLGHKEHAYEWLKITMEAGFGSFGDLMKDDDFASIREEDRFKKMVRETHLSRYLEMLERADRDDFQKPEEVMKTLAFKPGEKVADLGAGSGYFTIPIAKAVGPEGVVWAIDIRKQFLDYIAGRLDDENLENVRLQLVYPDDPQLPQGKVDTILLVDTWHYIRSPEYARKLRAGLAPGGRVVVIDYIPKPWEERPWGPPPQQHTPVEEISSQFGEAGLKLLQTYDFLPEQYFLVYGAE